MSIFLVPDSLPVHPPCPPWCDGDCRPWEDCTGLHHFAPGVRVPVESTEDDAAHEITIRFDRFDPDGEVGPVEVGVAVDGAQSLPYLTVDSARKVAAALLEVARLSEV